MDWEDAITISTPEGVLLRVVLAGAASRFIAGTIDLALQIVLLALSGYVTLGLIGGGVGEALTFIDIFLILFGYYLAFELLAAGRTPGKMLTHLRAVRDGGAPVDLPASAIRTLVRPIDFLPSGYLVGLLSIVFTRRNQRIGDLAAGTLVIREPPAARAAAPDAAGAGAAPPAARPPLPPGFDVSAVSTEEIAAVQRFLARRDTLDPDSRRALAQRLEQGLRPKVAGLGSIAEPESFLEALAEIKSVL